MSEFARYTITEAALDEMCDMIERIENMAQEYWKKTKKNTILHSCDVRAFAYFIKEQAKNTREYICDQIADQVQVTLTDEAIKIWKEAEASNNFVYLSKSEDGTMIIIDPTALTNEE